MRKVASVRVKGFSPFEQVELELKPLTVIIGRNSAGKSMLAYSPGIDDIDS